jgi:hypothetical protein
MRRFRFSIHLLVIQYTRTDTNTNIYRISQICEYVTLYDTVRTKKLLVQVLVSRKTTYFSLVFRIRKFWGLLDQDPYFLYGSTSKIIKNDLDFSNFFSFFP